MTPIWLDLARESRKAAHTLVVEEHFRSAVSRAYYAAYAKVAHELVAANVTIPQGREGPTHKRLRPTIETSMPNMNLQRRQKLSELIGRLYTLRIDADYKPSVIVDNTEARDALSMMKTVFDAF